jgi:outer membrane immunogenic protein
MKSLIIAVSAAVLALPLAAHAQVSASTFSPVTLYGQLGYEDNHLDGANLGAIQGRLGAKFGSYVGVEGELSGGVKSDTVNVGGTPVNLSLRNQEAIYGVGFLPITPKFDLFGRMGYGHSSIKGETAVAEVTGGQDSWNYGGGGQYFFDDKNGVRADYTRHEFVHGPENEDVWALGYVRKF